ncbi:hypothetical protein AB0D58_29155 [Streptomyces sp. NPDC048210]|uniref:hypothetical protein n=1 Tax=unclassified Streptomyces TaxID=2593676 RepID=UPI002E7A9892|nr:hypothetical protein [Streptomyces sp. JV181]MEE1775584.1 hypothetical protein [Streptomyces sp. JV181]
MTTPPPSKASRGLIAVAGALAATGCALVVYAMPTSTGSGPATARSSSPPAFETQDPTTPVGGPAADAGPPEATIPAEPVHDSAPSAPGQEEVLPEPGAGPRADPLVQRALERAVPADLAPADERQLTVLGRAVWLAEVTGADRAKWPSYFPAPGMTSGYSRVRIQGLIARRDTEHQADAVVHLVWAGADPSGTFLDGRTATLRFTHQAGTWIPLR